MKKASESKTIRWQVVDAMLTALLAGLATMEDIIPATYLVVTLLVLRVLSIGVNTWLRLVTSEPIGKGD